MSTGEFKVEHYADFGSGEPWVARVLLQWQNVLIAVPRFSEARESFLRDQGEVFVTLGMAFQVLRKLRQQVAKQAPALELEEGYASLYGYLWQAYKDRFQQAIRVIGPNLGFFWNTDERFEKGAAGLVAANPEYAELVALMRQYRENFHNALGYYRNNYLEHRDEPADSRMLESFHRLDAAEDTFAKVWRAIEAIVAGVVVANLVPPFVLVEIPEADRDPSRPERFRVGAHAGTAPRRL